MKRDINDFLTFKPLKNGKIKIEQTSSGKYNMFEYFYECGFRKAKLPNGDVYYRKEITGNKIIHKDIISEYFFNQLKQREFINYPKDIENDDILNWYLDKMPINGVHYFNFKLKDEHITKEEIHKLRMLSDIDYSNEFEITEIHNKLNERGFKSVIENSGTFTIGELIWYKNVEDSKYLVFYKYCPNENVKFMGFDFFIAQYKKEADIGKNVPISRSFEQSTFKLEKDFHLIEKYLI